MIVAKGEKVWVLRLLDGERLPEALAELGLLSAGVIAGIGMLRELRVGYWNGKKYVEERVEEPVELLSLQGNLAEEGGRPFAHLHLVVGKEGGEALGGHLLSAVVHINAEILVLPLSGIKLIRKAEPSGLKILHLEEG